MGLTFMAAGVSVPDALSSLAVVKEGYGDMAVSNAVGSNVFDILICLGLPWFIQTAIIKPGSHGKVYSKGMDMCITRAESDESCAETRFRLSEKRTSPFESAGVSFQSAGRRLCVYIVS
jgi:hypothetical protein